MRRLVIAAIVATGLLSLAIVIMQSRTRDPEIANAADLEDAAVFEEPPSFFVSDASLLQESGFPIVETLADESTREPVGDAPYFLQLADGRYAFGYTDAKGRTRPVFSRTKVRHSIHWYDDAWERWERTKQTRDTAATQQGGAGDGAARRR